MQSGLKRVGAFLFFISAVQCTQPVGTLDLTTRKRNVVDDGESIEISIRAATAEATVGAGTVSLKTKAGILGSTTVSLDEFGSARTTFACPIADDPGCVGTVILEASWKGATAELPIKVNERCPGGKLCSGGCARLSSDWSNCGACGVQCLGPQACLDGSCQPCPGGDCDGDGWTPAEGDCCDQFDQCSRPAAVNAGAIEEQGNGIDDNCNGLTDAMDPSDGLACDDNLGPRATDVMDYARAIGLCRTASASSRTWGVIEAELLLANGEPVPPMTGASSIRSVFGRVPPQEGARFAVLSSGGASDAVQRNPALEAGGTMKSVSLDCRDGGSPVCIDDWFYASSPPLKEPGRLPGAPGCGTMASQDIANDSIMLRLRIRAPTNAGSFRIKTRFFSEEYPQFVCSAFNDQMVLLIDTPGAFVGNPTDKNLMTYSDPTADGGGSWPVGINLAAGTPLFQTCVSQSANPTCWNPRVASSSCGLGPGDLAGTQFARTGDGGCPQGGATRWMTTRGNVKPGAVFELRAAVWDVGDSILDSVVLIDDFKWNVDAGVSGTGDD
ncbi:MAG: choice-of-anchor L domain-containing protein [Myxococcales bacterium]|nr:choice-of-anchor L domain-containing protein [Myxococcales bacterium]